MAKITVPWQGDERSFFLPERWLLQQTVSPEMKPAPQDWSQRLAIALDQPGTGVGLAKLLQARPNGRIVVVVEDVTRGGPLADIFEILMREIRHADIPAENIEVVFATGMHPPMMAEEVADKLGLTGKSIRWRCNSCNDRHAYVHIGRIGRVDVRIDREVASADLRIIVSSVSPHFHAGFGGGYRLFVPGCAHIETIRELNWLGLRREDKQFVGTEADANPQRAVIDAAGVLLDQYNGKSFAIQYLLDHDGQPTFVAAGEPIPTQRMLAKQCAVTCGIVTNTLADVLITNAYPRDFDLSQTLKSIVHTRWAVRPNGVILCLTSAAQGLRDVQLPGWPISAKWTRQLIRLFGPAALASLGRRLIPTLARDAAPYFRMAADVIYRNPIVMLAPALYEAGLSLPGIKLTGSFEQAVLATEELLHDGPLRTVVFPAGGATFPIVSPVTGSGLGAQ